MNATNMPRPPKAAGLAGSIISVAIVLGGGAAFAGEFTRLAEPAGGLTGPYGTFSSTDIAVLEQAVRAESTASNVALLHGDAPAVPAAQTQKQIVAASEVDLFPCSGRVLPLLVPRPDAVVQSPAMQRPGATQPVGVPYSVLRLPASPPRISR